MPRRALMTERERELISDPDAGDQGYVAVSRVRRKIEEELTTDVEVLAEHHPDLLDELRDVVCETGETDDIAERSVRESVDESREPEPSHSSSVDGESLDDAVREYLEENDSPPKTAHGRDLVLDVFRLLREEGAMKTGDVQEAVYPDYDDNWGSERTMWNAIDRYLEDIPGIEKAGYGEWGYAGDDTVREELAE